MVEGLNTTKLSSGNGLANGFRGGLVFTVRYRDPGFANFVVGIGGEVDGMGDLYTLIKHQNHSTGIPLL